LEIGFYKSTFRKCYLKKTAFLQFFKNANKRVDVSFCKAFELGTRFLKHLKEAKSFDFKEVKGRKLFQNPTFRKLILLQTRVFLAKLWV